MSVTFPAAVADLPKFLPYTKQDFLDLFERLLPSHYLDPLKDPGPGYELLQAYAAVAARISEAVAHVGDGSYIATADTGSYAIGRVAFYRDNTVYGGVILKAGTVVSTDDGYTYTTLADVTFEATDLGPHEVDVKATVRSWLYNKPGEKLAADGSTIPGSINAMTGPVLPDPLVPGYSFDPTIQVRQLTDTAGGSAAMLNGLGYDRGLPRITGESDEDYRVRISGLPDTVTPAAVVRLADRRMGETLAADGLHYTVNELWDLRIQTGYDHPMDVVVAPNRTVKEAPVNTGITNFSENVFVWDYDPGTQISTSGLPPSGYAASNRWFESSDYGASVIFTIPYDQKYWPLYRALAESLVQVLPAGAHAYFIFQP